MKPSFCVIEFGGISSGRHAGEREATSARLIGTMAILGRLHHHLFVVHLRDVALQLLELSVRETILARPLFGRSSGVTLLFAHTPERSAWSSAARGTVHVSPSRPGGSRRGLRGERRDEQDQRNRCRENVTPRRPPGTLRGCAVGRHVGSKSAKILGYPHVALDSRRTS